MSQTVYAMCGLAFSGKSTAARIIAREIGADLVSLDAINHERGLRGGEGMTDGQWEETSFIALDRVRSVLREHRSVVVDDTFSHRFLRDRFQSVAEEHGSRFVVVFMATSLEVVEARRAANDRTPTRHSIRDEVFARHRDGFQYPGDDEPVVRVGNDSDLAAWLRRERAARG